jgi:hypothetical protein
MEVSPAPSGTIALDIPANLTSLPVVRVFAGSVGRERGWDEPTTEDLRIVLSELAAAAVESPTAGARIEISAIPDGDRLRFRFHGIGSWGQRQDGAPARRSLLDALVPGAEYEVGGAEGIVASFAFPA